MLHPPYPNPPPQGGRENSSQRNKSAERHSVDAEGGQSRVIVHQQYPALSTAAEPGLSVLFLFKSRWPYDGPAVWSWDLPVLDHEASNPADKGCQDP